MIVGPIGISVLALGASTPVGRDAASSAAAVRAGVSGLTQHPYMIDTAGEPMRVAMAPWLEADMPVGHRMQSLLWPAVEQSLGALDPSRGPLRTGIALALPAPRPGRPEELESQLREALEERYAGVFSAVAVLPTGHAGGFAGLHAACQKLQEGALDACVVAGVESYLDADTLEWLESTEQFHGAGALNNAWGFIPGEAAGACLVARDDVADTLAVEKVARIVSVGRGFEPNQIRTKTVCVGEGLTAAFRDALAALPAGVQITDVYCDMNGEPYRADEFGFAVLRTGEFFVSASDFVAPADCWGDVSAASAPLSIMLSAIAGRKGYSNGALAFAWASSDGGDRGAAVLALRLPEEA